MCLNSVPVFVRCFLMPIIICSCLKFTFCENPAAQEQKCLDMKGNVQDEYIRTSMLAISQLESIHLHCFYPKGLTCLRFLGIEPMTLELQAQQFLQEIKLCAINARIKHSWRMFLLIPNCLGYYLKHLLLRALNNQRLETNIFINTTKYRNIFAMSNKCCCC